MVSPLLIHLFRGTNFTDLIEHLVYSRCIRDDISSADCWIVLSFLQAAFSILDCNIKGTVILTGIPLQFSINIHYSHV